MTYTSRQINRDFRLKVFGFLNGKKINMLVGVSGLLNLIGEELMEKQIARAYRSGKDVCVCKLRRGIQISYYAKCGGDYEDHQDERKRILCALRFVGSHNEKFNEVQGRRI